MFYLFIFIIILFFASHDVDRKFKRKSYELSYFFLFLIFWLVAGLRYETGVDWPGYTSYFIRSENVREILSNVSNSFLNSEFEFGYRLLNAAIKTFTDNVQWLFLFISFFTNLMLFSSIKKYSSHVFISLLIYFGTIYFVLDMSGIRQCIALNLFFISLDFIIKRDIFKYIAIILVASLFHITSLVLIPLYFILNINFKSWLLISFVFIGILISVFQISWVDSFFDNFTNSLYTNYIIGKLSRYSARGDSRNFGIGFILNSAIFLICLVNRKKFKENKLFNLLLNMYVISMFFYYHTWELNELSSRFRLYFSLGNVILFTLLIDAYKEKIYKSLVFIFIVSFSLFYSRIYIFEMPEGIAYNPYQNYVIYELFDLKSTGKERLEKYLNIF